ncbi:MAG: hypothetical protein RLZZ543_1792 [Bacteroidota bacterium]|jgi:hypothetical protein
MKKFVLYFFCLTGVCISQSLVAQTTSNQEIGKSTGEILKKTSENKHRTFFTLNMQSLSDNQRSAFVNQLYSSKIITVISRISEAGELSISSAKVVAIADVEQEISRIQQLVAQLPANSNADKY